MPVYPGAHDVPRFLMSPDFNLIYMMSPDFRGRHFRLTDRLIGKLIGTDWKLGTLTIYFPSLPGRLAFLRPAAGHGADAQAKLPLQV